MSSVSDIAFGPYLRAAIAALIASSRDITRLAGPLLLPEGGAPLIDREPPLPSTRRGVASSCVSTGACSSSADGFRSEAHTSELQSLMRISYAVFCLKKHKRAVFGALETGRTH